MPLYNVKPYHHPIMQIGCVWFSIYADNRVCSLLVASWKIFLPVVSKSFFIMQRNISSILFGLPFSMTGVNSPSVAACCLSDSTSLHRTATSSVSCLLCFLCSTHTLYFLYQFVTLHPSLRLHLISHLSLSFCLSYPFCFCSKCLISHRHLGLYGFLQSLKGSLTPSEIPWIYHNTLQLLWQCDTVADKITVNSVARFLYSVSNICWL